MQYTIRFSARLKGAIGILQAFEETIEADSEEQVILKLYDTYEHLQRPYFVQADGSRKYAWSTSEVQQ